MRLTFRLCFTNSRAPGKTLTNASGFFFFAAFAAAVTVAVAAAVATAAFAAAVAATVLAATAEATVSAADGGCGDCGR